MSDEEKRQRRSEASRRYAARHPDRVKAAQKKYNETNPGRSTAWNRENPENLKAQRARLSADPEVKAARRAYMKVWRAANPEKTKRYQAVTDAKDPPIERRRRHRARMTVEQRVEQVAGTMAWRAANRERYLAQSKIWREANRDYQVRWREAHPDASRVISHNRRAKIRANGGGKLSIGLADLLMAEQGGKCAACFCDLAVAGYHMDHFVPIARGGANEDWNIQLLCPPCNQSKADRPPLEFLAEKFGKET